MDAYQRIVCKWCNGQNTNPTSCAFCGAPLDVQNLVSQSGWREAPRLRDMTQIQFDQSTCQVEGEIVPVVEINLAPNEWVYFEHHCMLWKADNVPLTVMNLQGPKRSFFRMPHIVTIASGPGRVAFSRDATGEIVVLPLQPGMEMDVREHAFLLASGRVAYTYERIKGLANILHGGNGMWLDRFISQQALGLLVLHGYGNVFERTLAAGQSILLEPGAYLYKDSSVQMTVESQKLTTGLFGGTGLHMVRMTGPGRLGMQSMYVHHATE